MMVRTSASSVVLAVRVAGLALIAIGLGRRGNASIFGLIGAVVVGASFALTGHTSVNPLRWALAPLLMIHVMIVAF